MRLSSDANDFPFLSESEVEDGGGPVDRMIEA